MQQSQLPQQQQQQQMITQSGKQRLGGVGSPGGTGGMPSVGVDGFPHIFSCTNVVVVNRNG
jgi:hypothetical protein